MGRLLEAYYGVLEADDVWLVSFMDYDLGTSIWGRECSKRWKIRSARSVTYVLGMF
ncbi:MAG: hypothetical protein WB566_18905 [Terriglobales bacterium]